MVNTISVAVCLWILGLTDPGWAEVATQIHPDLGHRTEHRLDRKGDRTNQRLDRKVDRTENRLNRKGDHVDRHLDRKEDRVTRRLDHQGRNHAVRR